MARWQGQFLTPAQIPWLWEQSKIPSWIYLQPPGKAANPTQPRTMTSSLASFYNDCSVATRMPTQRRSSKNPSPHASLPRLPSKNLQSSSVQYCNSPFLPSSLPCVCASISKYCNRRNNKPKSSDFKISISSNTDGLSTTTIHPLNTPTGSILPSKCKRKMRRMTQQLSWYQVM